MTFIISPTDCTQIGDFSFVLDSSGSVSEANFGRVLALVKETTKNIELTPGYGKIGIMTFSTDAKMMFDMNRYDNSSMMAEAMDNIKYEAGKTNTAAALRMLRDSMYR